MATKKETQPEDIDKKIVELHEKLRVMRFSIAGNGSKNVKETRNIRRDIARLNTQKNAPATK